ncbi:hypothetical protein, partial [Frankia sp. Cr1]|uniref:hypothetical protein n=1 Tax=Frankia sp. Cr1 TaxID=3073931 RepID=UPI002AD51739
MIPRPAPRGVCHRGPRSTVTLDRRFTARRRTARPNSPPVNSRAPPPSPAGKHSYLLRDDRCGRVAVQP